MYAFALSHLLDWPPEYGQCVIVLAIILHFLIVRRVYFRNHLEDQRAIAELKATIERGFADSYTVTTRAIQAAQDQTPSQKQAFPPHIDD